MERLTFQPDKNPKHKSKSTYWLQQNKVMVLEWLSHSPDLNITEPLGRSQTGNSNKKVKEFKGI